MENLKIGLILLFDPFDTLQLYVLPTGYVYASKSIYNTRCIV